jgi:uncharacterized protein (AIM24 family)
MADWYVAVGGQQTGPFPEDEVAAGIREGRIEPSAYVFTQGMTEWKPVREVPQLAQHAAPAPAARPAATPSPDAGRRAGPAAAAAAGGAEPSHSIAHFLAATSEKDHPGDVFELESKSMLEVHVNGRVWSKLGAMVAYRGSLRFIREGAFEGGLGRFVTKMVSGETAPLSKIEGTGVVYLADEKKNVTILRLQPGDSINVNGNDLLAFEDSVQYKITMHRRIAGMMAGGLFSVRLTGSGMIAIMSHGAPLTLRCTPNDPILTDPNATVAWSGNLSPEIKTDISLRSLIGRGGGEAFQMMFRGDGFVVVQPYEEVPAVARRS